MMHYYGDTLDAANEEISKYTDNMEHLSSVLDHYNSILDLSTLAKDYARVDVVLKGSLKTAENSVKVNKELMDMYKD
jgi:hypothetical protein